MISSNRVGRPRLEINAEAAISARSVLRCLQVCGSAYSLNHESKRAIELRNSIVFCMLKIAYSISALLFTNGSSKEAKAFLYDNYRRLGGAQRLLDRDELDHIIIVSRDLAAKRALQFTNVNVVSTNFINLSLLTEKALQDEIECDIFEFSIGGTIIEKSIWSNDSSPFLSEWEYLFQHMYGLGRTSDRWLDWASGVLMGTVRLTDIDIALIASCNLSDIVELQPDQIDITDYGQRIHRIWLKSDGDIN